MKKFLELSPELTKLIEKNRESGYENPMKTSDNAAVHRTVNRYTPTLWRPVYVEDVERVLNNPFYNRYADKTQVFSFTHNDDITRRAQHVQLVSRIARNIGAVLGLNLDLIEAIALGHDIGHTPFGHAGERFLDEQYKAHAGRRFAHNVHSVRVMDGIFLPNISLQTLDGALCHNGEISQQEFWPDPGKDFAQFDREVEACYRDIEENKKIRPCTLEGCVVRVSDMIAYVGKDRQDAERAFHEKFDYDENKYLGMTNSEIINNLIVDIVEHSYGKDHIELSREAYEDLTSIKQENYAKIYLNDRINTEYEDKIGPMFGRVYDRLLEDVQEGNEESPVFRHHIRLIEKITKGNTRGPRYPESAGEFYDIAPQYHNEEANRLVTDYIASMTDDYFIALYEELFDEPSGIHFRSYFD